MKDCGPVHWSPHSSLMSRRRPAAASSGSASVVPPALKIGNFQKCKIFTKFSETIQIKIFRNVNIHKILETIPLKNIQNIHKIFRNVNIHKVLETIPLKNFQNIHKIEAIRNVTIKFIQINVQKLQYSKSQ